MTRAKQEGCSPWPRARKMAPFALVLHTLALQLLCSLGSSGSSRSSSSSSSGLYLPAGVRGGVTPAIEENHRSREEEQAGGQGNTTIPPRAVLIDANDIIDAMAQASGQRSGTDAHEQVFKQTHVYRSQVHHRSKRTMSNSGRSRLRREGDSLLRSLKTVTTRTTNGLARAVNVTGTAASVVAGGAFKLAGAAVLDAVDTWRFVAKGLRKTAETVYDFGVAAENVTAEATEVAEETIRSVVGSVINPASPGSDAQTRGYFSEEEDRIIDNMVFGMPPAAGSGGETTGAVDGGGGGGGGGGHVSGGSNMGYSEGDLATHFGRDARRGHHHHDSGRPYAHQQHQWQQGLLTGGPGGLRRRQPRLLALAARARYAIRLSIMRTSKAVPTMRFPQMVACAMVFACRAVTKNPWCGAASFVGARMYLKFVESIYLECLKERMTSDIKFEAVARLHEGSPERARWFNTAVAAMWVPMLEPLLSGWTSRQITRGIERSLPSNVSWVGLGKVTLGPTPPKIRYVQVQNVTSLAQRRNMGTSNGIIDSVLLEAGQPGGEIAGENIVYLEVGVDWTSSRSKVSLKLGEQSRRRNWWSLSSYVPTYRVKLCDLGIKGKVVVAMAVGDGRPFVKRLWVGFSEPPLTHMSLEALSGMDIANLPVLRKHLRHVVMRCLMPLTEPRFLNIEVKPPSPPPSSSRGAALAARVRPAALGVRRRLPRRFPGFGLRTLLGRGNNNNNNNNNNNSRVATTAVLAEAGEEGSGGGQGRELEEATRRLLVEVGGEFRDETVMAAEVSAPGGEDDGIVVEDVSSAGGAEGERRKGTTTTRVKAIGGGVGEVGRDGRETAGERQSTMPAKGEGETEKPKWFWKKLKKPELSSPPGGEEEEEEDVRKVPDRLEEEDLDWRGNPRECSERELAVAKNTADAEVSSRAEKKKSESSAPSTKARARLEEEGVDWMGNPRDDMGRGEKEETRVSSSVEVKTARRRQRPRSSVVTNMDGEKLKLATGGAESPPRDVVASPTAKEVKIIPLPKAASMAKPGSSSSSSSSASSPAGKNKKATPKTSPEAETAAVVAAEPRRRLTKSEAVRVRRAQIKRRRAALLEEKGGSLSAASALVKSLRGRLGKVGGRRRSNPQREGIIQSVCALSRPPPPQADRR
ncbi:unnamed protein product [Ectocarpus sp. CCAP 1310/34]|nr:unnamed protein product [Ectocarpus sp. CCAP 1310/34]